MLTGPSTNGSLTASKSPPKTLPNTLPESFQPWCWLSTDSKLMSLSFGVPWPEKVPKLFIKSKERVLLQPSSVLPLNLTDAQENIKRDLLHFYLFVSRIWTPLWSQPVSNLLSRTIWCLNTCLMPISSSWSGERTPGSEPPTILDLLTHLLHTDTL